MRTIFRVTRADFIVFVHSISTVVKYYALPLIRYDTIGEFNVVTTRNV